MSSSVTAFMISLSNEFGHVVVSYTYPEDPYMNLYVGFYKSQSEGATYLFPKNCLSEAGWNLMRSEVLEMRVPGFAPMTVNKVLMVSRPGACLANENRAKSYLSCDAVTRSRIDGSLMRVSVPIVTTEAVVVERGVRSTHAFYPQFGGGASVATKMNPLLSNLLTIILWFADGLFSAPASSGGTCTAVASNETATLQMRPMWYWGHSAKTRSKTPCFAQRLMGGGGRWYPSIPHRIGKPCHVRSCWTGDKL